MSVLSSFGLSMKDEDCALPLVYWIPELHKCPYKQRYITEAAKSSTKPLSKILTSIFTAVKTGLQKYHDTCFSRSGGNQMWKLENFCRRLSSRSRHVCNSIKTFDFSTLYTTIIMASMRNLVRRNKAALRSGGQAETSLKIEDLRSNKTTGKLASEV
jgi:hypothetical protein